MSEEEDTSTLAQAMLQPKKVEVDNKTVEQHPLQDVIAMHRYTEAIKASKRPGFGIRFAKFGASGSV